MSTRDYWYQALRELAARNAPVQVTALSNQRGPDGQPEPLGPPSQTRLLHVGDDESLTLELPPVPEQARTLRRAAALDVLALSGGQRWLGRCPVAKEMRHQLNDRTAVLALRLSPAEAIHSGQRRNFFRVDVAGGDRLPVRLVLADPAGDEPRTPFKAWLHNLSGGGMGLCVDRLPDDARAIIAGRLYHCQFPLPDNAPDIAVRAHLIHARPTPDRTLYLGLAFHFADAQEQRRVQEQIIRFTTALERKHLQRRRTA